MLVRDLIAARLRDAVGEAQRTGALPPFDLPQSGFVERPQKADHGDFASGLPLRVAKAAKRPPLEIAQALADSLAKAEDGGPVGEVSAAPPGFVNFRFERRLAPRPGGGGPRRRRYVRQRGRGRGQARADRVREREPDRTRARRSRARRGARQRARQRSLRCRFRRHARVLRERRGQPDGALLPFRVRPVRGGARQDGRAGAGRRLPGRIPRGTRDGARRTSRPALRGDGRG